MLSLSHLKLVCRLLEACNTGPGDCTAASLEPGHQHVLDLTVDLTWHLLDHLHLSLCLCILHDVLITPFREWNLLCFISFLQCLCVVVFWHCISAGTSTFMYCCCETSVLCCTFWMYCTCGNFNGLCNVWTIMSNKLHLVNLVSLHTESGESYSLLWMNGFFLCTVFMMIWNSFAGS